MSHTCSWKCRLLNWLANVYLAVSVGVAVAGLVAVIGPYSWRAGWYPGNRSQATTTADTQEGRQWRAR